MAVVVRGALPWLGSSRANLQQTVCREPQKCLCQDKNIGRASTSSHLASVDHIVILGGDLLIRTQVASLYPERNCGVRWKAK